MNVTFEKAIEILKNEGVVALPTETVYGLAARFDSEKAIRKVFETKKRPKDHPLIVHVHDETWVSSLASEIPDYAFRLMSHFWPGPLTCIFQKKKEVSHLITAGENTVAVRVPNHELTLKLLRKINVPLVAPSANIFCRTSPTCAKHVEDNFNSQIPVLDGGPCDIGIESTIISCIDFNEIVILRPGIISKNEIEEKAQIPVIEKTGDEVKQKIPGSHKAHYQPNKKLIYFENPSNLKKFLASKKNDFYLISINQLDLNVPHIKMPSDPKEYAKLLYSVWQSQNDLSIESIYIEMPPNTEKWQGIRNRIQKAGNSLNDFFNEDIS